MRRVMNAFTQEFKFYRQIKELSEISNTANKYSILDLQCLNAESFDDSKLKICNLHHTADEEFLSKNASLMKNYGLRQPSEWKCFELTYVPGLLIIPNPFKNGYQRYFVKRTLMDYPCLPNKTNIDIHEKRSLGENLWENAMQKSDFTEYNKLRWATIGYHYNWDTKLYSQEDFNEMPEDVSNISVLIAKLLGYEAYRPEAGIINYYHLNSTLNAHQDRSELNMEAPLVSVSFGNPAIFLIGDATKETKPYAMLIRSGDIMVMTKESRLAYHGITRVLREQHLNENYFTYDGTEENAELKASKYYVNDDEWARLYEYIGINRINYSIRQVYD